MQLIVRKLAFLIFAVLVPVAQIHAQYDHSTCKQGEELTQLGRWTRGIVWDYPNSDTANALVQYIDRSIPSWGSSWDTNAQGQYEYGLLLAVAGDRESAREALTRALELDPSCLPAEIELIRLMTDNVSFEDALLMADEVIEANPERYEGYLFRGNLYLNVYLNAFMNRDSESQTFSQSAAEYDFERALELNPESGATHAAYALLINRDFPAGHTLFHIGRANDLGNDEPRLYFALASLYGRTNQFGLAFEALRIGLEKAPYNEYGCYQLALLDTLVKGELIVIESPPEAQMEYFQWIIDTNCHLEEGA
jgi:tetratricopeptide (TPR) repeat protein